jgi:hypothetical protein
MNGDDSRKILFGKIRYFNCICFFVTIYRLTMCFSIPTKGLFHVCTASWKGVTYRMWKLYFLVFAIEIYWNERNMYR